MLNNLRSLLATQYQLGNLLNQWCNKGPLTLSNFNQVRFRYVDWLMLRDVKRRKLTAEYAHERTRYGALINNNILPDDLRESANTDMRKLPKDSLRWRIVDRCVVTSRARGNVPRWRMSRFVFRHNADYNKLSGVTKAKW